MIIKDQLGLLSLVVSISITTLSLYLQISTAAELTVRGSTSRAISACAELPNDPPHYRKELDLAASRRGSIHDGAGGIDTINIKGGSYVIMDGERYRSFELLNSKNGRFETLIILTELFPTTENGEV